VGWLVFRRNTTQIIMTTRVATQGVDGKSPVAYPLLNQL